MTSPGLLSFKEFENLPDSPGKQELLDGELIQLPPAKKRHMVVAKRFLKLLGTILDESRVWFETGYQIGNGWLVPDISATWPDHPVANDYHQGGPMIAIEIESPGNTAEELDRKVVAYLQAGAGEIWVVYPKTFSMLVYTGSGKVIRVMDEYRSDLLPGLAVNLRELLVETGD
jgi:Uma2 family endonuclease